MKKTRQLLEELFESEAPDLNVMHQAIRYHMSKGHDLETAKELAWQQSDSFPRPRAPRPAGHTDRIRAVANEPSERPSALNVMMAIPAQRPAQEANFHSPEERAKLNQATNASRKPITRKSRLTHRI